MSALGQNSEVRARNLPVRFTLKNRHRQAGRSRSKSARNGLTQLPRANGRQGKGFGFNPSPRPLAGPHAASAQRPRS
jgi:hypothetical protein